MITADELRAMPMQEAVVAYLRACRTFDPIGDIDGPWHDAAKPFIFEAAGVTDMAGYEVWERAQYGNRGAVFAAYDKAIAAAERHLPSCPGPYDWCVYANLCAADDCRKSGIS